MQWYIKVGLIAMGGASGALCRYFLSVATGRWLAVFPLGTLLANLIGCFCIGICFALADRTLLLTPAMRLMIMTGFLGSLTTFSTYALETVTVARAGLVWTAVGNLVLNNIGGLLLVLSGMWVVRLIPWGGE